MAHEISVIIERAGTSESLIRASGPYCMKYPMMSKRVRPHQSPVDIERVITRESFRDAERVVVRESLRSLERAIHPESPVLLERSARLCLMSEIERFKSFDLGELQQLLASVTLAIRCRIIAPGPGNLLAGLAEELGEALHEKAQADEHADSQ